jgi:capsular polysaccharide biosynthesis protein
MIQKAIALDFKILHPEDYSIQDQVKLFRYAEVIAGEDGSAMHNIGFSEKSPLVLMLARDSRYNFWHIPVAKISNSQLRVIDNLKGISGYLYPDNFLDEI